MAVHQNRKKDTLILSQQMLVNMQMNVVSLPSREGFALLMFLTRQPILGILCAVFPAYSHWPRTPHHHLGKACFSVCLLGRPKTPLALNGGCDSGRGTRVLSGSVLSWHPGLSGHMTVSKGLSSCVGSVCGISWASMGWNCK